MKRLSTLAAWIFLSFLSVAGVNAADAPLHLQVLPGQAPVIVPEDPAAADIAPDDPQAQQDATNGQGTPTTPAAALFWQAREKARYENKVRAEAMREQEISKETTVNTSTTKSGKAAKKKQEKSKDATK